MFAISSHITALHFVCFVCVLVCFLFFVFLICTGYLESSVQDKIVYGKRYSVPIVELD